MKSLTLLVASLLFLVACDDRDDSWGPRTKYRAGELVIFRLTGELGMVISANCTDLPCLYRVRSTSGYGKKRTFKAELVREFEIGKAPQRACEEDGRGSNWLVYQAGDQAAQALCKR